MGIFCIPICLFLVPGPSSSTKAPQPDLLWHLYCKTHPAHFQNWAPRSLHVEINLSSISGIIWDWHGSLPLPSLMVRITHFPDHITFLWWWTACAYRETSKLDIIMENKARLFNVGVCKLWPQVVWFFFAYKEKGEANIWMFTLYMKLRIRII